VIFDDEVFAFGDPEDEPGRTSAIGKATSGGTHIGTDQTRRIQRRPEMAAWSFSPPRETKAAPGRRHYQVRCQAQPSPSCTQARVG